MRRSPRLSDCCIAPSHCLIGKPETIQDEGQEPLSAEVGIHSDLMGKRVVGDRIVERQRPLPDAIGMK